jgi:N-methylhydantoinase A
LDRAASATCRVGIDIGGTFTDLVVVDGQGKTFTKKVSSTPDNYARAITEGLASLLEPTGLGLDRITEFLHGTTVGSNTILELKGARLGLITTKGFRDVLEIRNLRMPKLYDLHWEKPAPLIERYLRVTVNERIDSLGNVTIPMSREEVVAAVKRLLTERVEGIAVCLLNSYANPEHERMVADVIRELAPNLPISVSVDVLPQMKEYERTSTTVVNAYIMPIVASYLKNLEENLRPRGMDAPILLMQSSGGLTTSEDAAQRPVNIVESGPAAGVVGAVRHAVECGHPNIISFDMGGTTAKASVAEDGKFVLSQQYSVGGGIMISSRLLTGGGYLLAVPAIDVAEVGAGGGSIVWIDAGGSMQIGPESAGANPGPVCYDKGGDRPTVTDANVILGYINPKHLVGGELSLNAERSRQYFETLLATPLGVDVTTAAYAARQIAISNMIRAIKAVSSERGRDPRGFTLFALGGNGALFAAGMAQELGIRTILVPPSAGLFSAYGLLHADVEHYYSEPVRKLIREVERQDWDAGWSRLEAKARKQLDHDGFTPEEVEIRRSANMRYKGQTFEISVPIPAGALTPASMRQIEEAFGDEHERTYGHRATLDEPIQITSIQVGGLALRQHGQRPGRPEAHAGDAETTKAPRKAYFGREHGWLDTAVLSRSALRGETHGPCIVEEYDTTCVVPPGARVHLDDKGNIIMSID